MSILSRYLLRQSLFLLFSILLIGVGLYVLTDLFERLDNFLESNSGLRLLIVFFCMKIPTIIAQILPAVYMLSLVVLFNILERSRELTALTAGGVSPAVLLRFVLLYGIALALVQFTLAQVLGVTGERAASQIWQEDVRGKILSEADIEGIWFTEKHHIVYISRAYPVLQKGDTVLVYTLDQTGAAITEIIKAKRFTVSGEKTWILEEGERIVPATYAATAFTRMELPIRQDLRAFQIAAHSGGIKANQLSMGELRKAITRLEQAGSNVEGLRTAWHGKMAYACSIVVMGILALLITRLTPSIYKAIAASLLTIFLFFSINTLSMSMGEKGIVAPFFGAWFAVGFFLFVGVFWLLVPGIRSRLRH